MKAHGLTGPQLEQWPIKYPNTEGEPWLSVNRSLFRAEPRVSWVLRGGADPINLLLFVYSHGHESHRSFGLSNVPCAHNTLDRTRIPSIDTSLFPCAFANREFYVSTAHPARPIFSSRTIALLQFKVSEDET
jgi:hypothetical protein